MQVIAKIASDMDKPNGQYRVQNDASEVESFVRKLPVRKMGGIGKVSAFMLKDAFGIETVADLYEKRHVLPFDFKQARKVIIGNINSGFFYFSKRP